MFKNLFTEKSYFTEVRKFENMLYYIFACQYYITDILVTLLSRYWYRPLKNISQLLKNSTDYQQNMHFEHDKQCELLMKRY